MDSPRKRLANPLAEAAPLQAKKVISIPGRRCRCDGGHRRGGLGKHEPRSIADHAVAAADALSWNEPFFIVRHSHGGGVAQAAAVKYPGRVAGIVLIATLGAPAHLSYRLLSAPRRGCLLRTRLDDYFARMLFGCQPRGAPRLGSSGCPRTSRTTGHIPQAR